MAQFVQCLGNEHFGYPMLNLNRVTELRKSKDSAGNDCWEALDARGNRMGRFASYHLPKQVRYIQNTSAVTLTLFSLYEDGTLAVREHPIPAWSIEDGDISPVFLDGSPCSNQAWAYHLPGDRYLFPGECEFPTLASATDYAKEVLGDQKK